MKSLRKSGIRAAVLIHYPNSEAACHIAAQNNLEEFKLGRFFHAFPGGVPGIALLLLRSAFSLTVIIQGTSYIGRPAATPAAWFAGLLALAIGSLILVGFLTPLAAIVAGLAAAGVASSVLPASTPNAFESRYSAIFAVSILFAIFGVGPGRFSIDARLFGRRQIIIPPSSDRSLRDDGS